MKRRLGISSGLHYWYNLVKYSGQIGSTFHVLSHRIIVTRSHVGGMVMVGTSAAH